MPRPTAIVLAVALTGVAVAIAGCRRSGDERDAAREELDEEFEAQTREVQQEADRLALLLDELVASHEVLDARHAELDAALKGMELDAEGRAIQAKHEQWEEGHRFLIEQARAELARFAEVHAQHERDEAGHAEASPEQLREDHERFERELGELGTDLAARVHELQLAKQQMDVIFADHEVLESRYSPGSDG